MLPESFRKVLRAIYNGIPLKPQAYKQLRNFGRLPEAVYQHLHFKGVFDVAIDTNHSFKLYHHGHVLENRIFWDGLVKGHEEYTMRLWIRLCKRAEVIVDVGANTGLFSLVAKCLRPQAEVIAFEPITRVYQKLVRNNDLNNYNIKCIQKAVSDTNGEALIHDSATEHTYNATIHKQPHHSDTHLIQTKVETVRLDTFFNNNKTTPDLIKIDAERHETYVVRGLGEILQKQQPTILIEVLNDEIGIELEQLFRPHAYKFYNIVDNVAPLETEQIRRTKYPNYLICTAETAAYLNIT